MDAELGSLDYWQRLLIAYAVVLCVEAPILLFVAALRRRPWYEHALALLPVGGVALGLYLARSARTLLADWQSHVAFQQAHYPPTYWATFASEQRSELQALVDSVQQQAVAMGGLTLVLLIGGWMLLLRWLPNPRYQTHTITKEATAELPSEDDLGSLEITIEPIEREH